MVDPIEAANENGVARRARNAAVGFEQICQTPYSQSPSSSMSTGAVVTARRICTSTRTVCRIPSYRTVALKWSVLS
jgi:hypothetical protein